MKTRRKQAENVPLVVLVEHQNLHSTTDALPLFGIVHAWQ